MLYSNVTKHVYFYIKRQELYQCRHYVNDFVFRGLNYVLHLGYLFNKYLSSQRIVGTDHFLYLISST